MKISLKYYILFFAVGMMSFVACSDDDDDETTPPPTVIVPPTTPPPSTVERIISISNGDSANFTVISAILDSVSTQKDFIEIKGRNSANTESINITFGRTFKETATYPQATEQVISYIKDGSQFAPTISGTLVVSRNDSIIAGTFEFVGEPLNGLDSLTVTGGEFYLEL